MKARTIKTAPQRAENIFTDREEPRRAFWTVYDRVKSDPGSVEAISYYGVGGIGKSSLLFQLMRELKERAPQSPNIFYSFELSGRGKDDCLYYLAESLMQRCNGLRFPLFGTALLRLNELAGRDIRDLEKRLDAVHITANKNTIPGEKRSANVTSGVRLGTPAATTRGMGVEEMKIIADCIADCIHNFDEKKDEIAARVLALTERFPLYE